MPYKDREKRNAYVREYNKRNPLTLKQKKSYQIRKRKLMIKKKSRLVELYGNKCSKCGYNKCIHALDFHHKDKNIKEIKISRANNYKKMLKEAKKCILLCSNCHREIHAENWK